tara:strand:+ start:331 stop:513 length:183 start_codon:yes stop_codon:yes gene_type:complete
MASHGGMIEGSGRPAGAANKATRLDTRFTLSIDFSYFYFLIYDHFGIFLKKTKKYALCLF